MNFGFSIRAESAAQAIEQLNHELRQRGDPLRVQLLEVLLHYVEEHYCQGKVYVLVDVVVD